MRRANRRARRALRRREYRRLRKCHKVEAVPCETYETAQEYPAANAQKRANKSPEPQEPDPNPNQPAQLQWRHAGIATLNLDGGITHLSGREKVIHLMKEHELDILTLQETRVNVNSVEVHDGYTFYFSTNITHDQKARADQKREQHRQQPQPSLTEIELYNLDAEKHGVAIVYSPQLTARKQNVQQVNGRTLLATFNTYPVKTNVVAAYAPHAGRNEQEKDEFYSHLNHVAAALPKHEINIFMGDFNARLMEQLGHESNVIGPHIFRNDTDNISQLSVNQQDNRFRFTSFCQEHELVATNTWFEKPLAKLITHRNAATPNYTPPFTTDRFGQIDYILVNHKWRNAITNVETSSRHAVSTDHRLLIAQIRVKLARTPKRQCQKTPRYRQPTVEQLTHYNDHVQEMLQAYNNIDQSDAFQIWAKVIHTAANEMFTRVPPSQKKRYISEETWQLLQEKQAKNENNQRNEAQTLERQIRRQVRIDRRKHIKYQLEEIDAQGYKWNGLKRLRRKFVPRHSKFKDKDGNYITEENFVNAAAEYLSSVQWKKPEGHEPEQPSPLSRVGAQVTATEWEPHELDTAIKNNKTPGPDEITPELLKWLSSVNRGRLLSHYNQILMHERYPDLLQTFYKILAAMTKMRLEEALDPWLLKTQYGFRRKRSTAQAIFLARRLMDIAERQGTNLTLTLLDWAKTFDKVDQSKLVKVLQRLCIPERMVNLVRNIYRYAQFRVVQGEHSSAFHRQESGIRQGCPLSPYLFGIIMTAIFQDIKTELNTPKQLQPIHGINYAEVLYADDTLLFGTHTQTINKLLRQVQVESAKYNLALNFEKCINLTINRKQSSVKFMNGAQVPRKTQATYLGATLTDAVDNHGEVIKLSSESEKPQQLPTNYGFFGHKLVPLSLGK